VSLGVGLENIGQLAVLKLHPPEDFVSVIDVDRVTAKPFVE